MAGSVGEADGDVGFQIAPMVDVVFVLMLFFMASAGSQVSERELGINLPSGAKAGASAGLKTPIIISIDANGQVNMNDKNFGNPQDKNLNELKEWLTNQMARFDDQDPVIIRPVSETRHERIIDVLNAAAAAGVKNLTFS
jgi:biopolymer transport protein ExbD